MNKLNIDKEFQDLISPLTPEEFNQLETNILKDGIRDPIVCWKNTIVDGHNRYKIASKHDLEYQVVDKDFDGRESVIDWMINNQLGSRNLSHETQSYLRGLQYQREKKKEPFNGNQYTKSGEGNNCPDQTTSKKLSEQHNVSERTIKNDARYSKDVDTITANTAPDIKHKILNGEIEISKKDTKQLAKLEPAKQKEIIEKSIEENISVKEVMNESVKIKPAEVKEVEPELSYMEGAENLQEILENISMQLGLLVGQAETELLNLPKSTVNNAKHQVGACIQAIHKCADRLEISLKMSK